MPAIPACPSVDVLRLLQRQQTMIEELLARYRAARRAQALRERDARTLMRSFSATIALHLRLQEEILYPAARELLQDPGLLSSLEGERRSVRELLDELDEQAPQALLSGVRLAVLSDRLEHLFQREQGQLFARLGEAALH
jgi:hypothetical protein